MRKVMIFDTTLRDGEQSPGFAMSVPDKVRLAEQLVRLGVDVIEAGFPIASNADFESVREIARAVGSRAVVAGLGRARPEDLDRAIEALKGAPRARIHTFIATSDLHMTHKLRMSREQVIEAAVAAVRRARRFTDDVEFSPEDATRSDRDFLCRVLEAVLKEGARTLNIPDTVGHVMPWEFGALIRDLRERVPGIEGAVISVHCHDDLGLAVANSLEAVRAGAGQVECTINGIGERAGNAALEEIVMTLRHRSDQFGVETGVRTEEIFPTSALLVEITGIPVQPNKAVVGANAFTHASGVHQHGVISQSRTYEIFDPRSVGVAGTRLYLGKHSGRHALRRRMEEIGLPVDEASFDDLFRRFKDLADQVKEVTDEDLRNLVGATGGRSPVEGPFVLEHLQFTSGTDIVSHATVTMKVRGETVMHSAWAYGPVEAACKAIDQACGMTGKLLEYSLRAATPGKDAVGEVRLVVEYEGARAEGRGASVNVVESSARAYVEALNRLAARRAPGERKPG